jgi:hypothetical protein
MPEILSVVHTSWKTDHSELFEISFFSKNENYIIIRIFLSYYRNISLLILEKADTKNPKSRKF